MTAFDTIWFWGSLVHLRDLPISICIDCVEIQIEITIREPRVLYVSQHRADKWCDAVVYIQTCRCSLLNGTPHYTAPIQPARVTNASVWKLGLIPELALGDLVPEVEPLYSSVSILQMPSWCIVMHCGPLYRLSAWPIEPAKGTMCHGCFNSSKAKQSDISHTLDRCFFGTFKLHIH